MTEWTSESNGHLLVVKMDKQSIFESIEEDIKRWEEILADANAAATEEDCESILLDEQYERCVIGSTIDSEYMGIEDCIADLKAFEKAAEDFSEKSAEEVFEMCVKKKNGTFKINTRPVISRLNFGTLYEEAYGWSTTQLRIRPVSDTEAIVELDSTVVKW